MSTLSNYEKWRSYCEGFISPDCFIDWGFYYLISASLQRRVWTGPIHQKLFPNMYVIFVADPAVGKGLITRQVMQFLKYHRIKPAELQQKEVEQKHALESLSAEDKQVAEAVIKTNFEDASLVEGKKNKRVFELPLTIPVGASSTTYEGLVNSLAASLRRINTVYYDEKLGKNVLKPYSHSSLAFCLEEIASLFRKRTEDVVKFLLETYDCGDYEYDTKTPGLKDYVKKCCMSLLGGTQPSFMQELFNDRLLTDGFASRCIFIYAHKNRKTSMFIPELKPEQEQHRQDILAHIKKLTTLYGHVTILPETQAYLEEWWKDAQIVRPNTSHRLDHYYGRKNMHVLKLMLALHFSESTEMTIQHHTCLRTIEVLSKEEKKMHFALGIDNTNPLAAPAMKILKYLKNSEAKSFRELLTEFWGILPGRPTPNENLMVILEHLTLTNKIKRIEKEDKVTGKNKPYWTTIKEAEDKMPGEL